MKNKVYKALLLLLLIPTALLADPEKFRGKYTKEKTINKEFSVNENALLKIKNRYGNLNVTSWDQNTIVMEVSITVNGDDEDIVTERLEGIQINFENSPSQVTAKTQFGEDNQSWWTKVKCSWTGNKVNMEVNYTVKVPVNNHVDFNNDYGSISLDRINGNATIHCDYGQVILGELLGNENALYFDYSHNSSITYMKKGKINADYSDFVLNDAETLILNADYTGSKIKKVDTLEFNCDYGSLRVDEARLIEGNGDYLDTKIGIVSSKIDLVSDYGAIVIKKLNKTIESVNIRTDYTGVKIAYDPNCSFDCMIKTSYGGITTDIETLQKNKEITSKKYEGYYGTDASKNTIAISTSYGSVKLTSSEF